MNPRRGKKALALVLTLLSSLLAAGHIPASPVAAAAADIEAVFLGQSYFTERNQQMTRYSYLITKPEAIPIPSLLPQLTTIPTIPTIQAKPACVPNKDATPLGLSFTTQQEKQSFKAFCGAPSRQGTIVWFTLPTDEVPPSWVYIVYVTTRPPVKTLKSGLLETTL